MHDLPRGTVTFLFTDIEGSTRLWHAHPDTMPSAYARHDAVLRSAATQDGGVIFKTVGDAMQIAFPTAIAAVQAAVSAQRALQAESWPTPEPLKVRMALHTGGVEPTTDRDYRSPVLNRLGRLLGAGHGEQVLVSQATMELARDHLPGNVTLLDLGEQRLKDLYRPERVFQLTGEGLADTFPRLRTLDTHPNNLPMQPTQLVGRGDDVAAIRQMLARPEVRLVTLIGPGGIGKTRLALQVGADSLDRYPDGVFLVSLDAISDPALVPETIARVLNLREEGDTPIATTLTQYLGERQTLLVLDNLEQVIEAATFIGQLLASCRSLKIVATSRTRLRLRIEQEYPVQPLELPDTSQVDVATVSQYESVRLFIERAQSANPAFAVSNATAPAIAEICTRLDGLPLAIELAAARVKILPPEAMLRRLESRLPLLTGGARDLPLRQQTLRGAIAWSHELLSPEDQALFRRLSVFAGGASLEAIERVVAGEGQKWDLFAILEGMERLVNQSLVRQTEVAGEPRFSMFETIREFGLDELEQQGEAEEARRSHAQYVADLVATYRWEFSIVEMAAWLDRVEREHDNVRAALAWTLEHDPALAVHIAGFTGRYWLWRNHFREGRAWLNRALAITCGEVCPEDRARSLRTVAIFDEAIGEWDVARARLEESQLLYEAVGDRRQVAFGLSQLAPLQLAAGDFQESLEMQRTAIAIAREIDDALCLLWCLNNLAVVAYDAGELDIARQCAVEALDVMPGAPDMYASTIWSTAADIFRLDGDIERAEQLYAASLRDARTGGLISIVIADLMGLVMASVATERWERAARLAGAEAALRKQGDNALDPNFTGISVEYDDHLARLMEAMGADAFRASWDAGAALPLDMAIAEALDTDVIDATASTG